MAQEISELRVVRGRVRKAVTDFAKYVGAVTLPLDVDEVGKLKVKLARVMPKLAEFEALHYRIEGDEADDELSAFTDAFDTAVGRANGLIEEQVRAPSCQPARAPSEVSDMSAAQARLPAISLPKFSGQPSEWLEFRDSFTAMIHGNNSMSEVSKMYYLKSALTGEASRIIAGLPTSAANYAIAWSHLKDRYENRRRLIRSHVTNVRNHPKMEPNSAVALRSFADTITQDIRPLEALRVPICDSDVFLFEIIYDKLDDASKAEWERTQNTDDLPSVDEFLAMLKKRAEVLEAIRPSQPPVKNTEQKTRALVVKSYGCHMCGEAHSVYNCPALLSADLKKRVEMVRGKGLGTNCLFPGHKANACERPPCIKCQQKHNRLLHENMETVVLHAELRSCIAVLPTAIVRVATPAGVTISCRALLDTGAQCNFITKRLAKKLRVKTELVNVKLSGVGNSAIAVKERCRVVVAASSGVYKTELSCYAIAEISDSSPRQEPLLESNLPANVVLADPNYGQSADVDLLIGVSHFWEMLRPGRIHLPSGLTLIETTFGWVASGVPQQVADVPRTSCHMTQTTRIEHNLQQFCEIKNVEDEQRGSAEEQFCGEHFASNTRRDSNGRFVVGVPLREGKTALGDSRERAMTSLLCMEKKSARDRDFGQLYQAFMREYISLGHMTLVPPTKVGTHCYFLPHHGVLNKMSTTTKLRVVFDGSAATTSGKSRNNIECVGPVVQSELFSILLRFRSRPIVIGADVEKMYRQVLVRDEDQDLQHILWRDSPSAEIEEYALRTVTYGTASASFLATRCLHELGSCIRKTDAKFASVIQRDFYVDDLLTGVDTVAEGRKLCRDINKLLLAGGFPLRKWISNRPEVFDDLPANVTDGLVSLGESDCVKTLGLQWSPSGDYLTFKIEVKVNERITKRIILSVISRVFDPLGLVGACVISSKILLQELWLTQIEWNAEVPQHIGASFKAFCKELNSLNDLRIPRYQFHPGSSVELHDFSDASERAYGACVYVKCADRTSLLCAKARVAPLKTLTMPKLELCAALVLAQLTKRAKLQLELPIAQVVLWSDSSIVLSWLRRATHDLKIFVANRVEQIRECVQECEWRYVNTAENPADLISRGMSPSDLKTSTLWWNGPAWLSLSPNNWPENRFAEPVNIPELKVASLIALRVGSSEPLLELNRFSSYTRLRRVVAYVLRFYRNCRGSREHHTGSISPSELERSQNVIARMVQAQEFPDLLQTLANGADTRNIHVRMLVPFSDEEGVIRVGGRLREANLGYSTKHPILLPKGHTLVKLVAREVHTRSGHCGPQQLLALMREEWWPLRGRDAARHAVHQCVRCFRVRPRNNAPLMGDLPKERVTLAFPFDRVGVDYAGPFNIRLRAGRGIKTHKCNVCLFICLVTKAIHIEIAVDLTTASYIAALRRFVARRGKPTLIISDNGRNFVGANRELRSMFAQLREGARQISDTLANDGIEWKFIPPNSPHFGGLREAGIKSAKTHLKRILANAKLTNDELLTVCLQVEAILNSRPLCPLSNDPNDLEALSPGHFLIGRKLLALPPRGKSSSGSQRQRYALLQNLTSHFWQRWRKEYLHTLQMRSKWKKKSPILKHFDLVVVHEEQLPPIAWHLGRIIETFPGKDGQVRVATIKTQSGEFRRPVTKLYPLPLDETKNCERDVGPILDGKCTALHH